MTSQYNASHSPSCNVPPWPTVCIALWPPASANTVCPAGLVAGWVSDDKSAVKFVLVVPEVLHILKLTYAVCGPFDSGLFESKSKKSFEFITTEKLGVGPH